MRVYVWMLGTAVAIVTAIHVPFGHAAQVRPPQTLAMYLQGQYAVLTRNIIGSVDKMPAEEFSFRPAPEVMSYAELLTHVAETQHFYCSTMKEPTNTAQAINFKVTDRTAVTAVVKASFAYCDDVFAGLTDENALTMFSLGAGANQRQLARAAQMTQVLVHGNEHYGNLVTYMRMKGIVPPSSAQTPP